MMDIVQRLRDAHPNSQQYAAGSMILSEAADEIERNRAAIAELVGHLEWAMSQPFMSYSHRIKNQNTAWCDKVDAARAAITKHTPNTTKEQEQ